MAISFAIGTSLYADSAPPLIYVSGPASGQPWALIYSTPNGQGGPWPSFNFDLPGIAFHSSAPGSTFSSTLTVTGGDWSIGSIWLYARGDEKSKFQLDYTCNISNPSKTFVQGCSGAGQITGTLSGAVFDPRFPEIPYYLVWAVPAHWIETSSNNDLVTLSTTASIKIIKPDQQSPTAGIAPVMRAATNVAVFLDALGSAQPPLSHANTPGASLITYQWDIQKPNGEDKLFGPQVTYAWSASGTFLVTLTVTDSDGLTGTTSTTVSVPPPPTLSCPAAAGTLNLPYASTFAAFGGTGTFTAYSISSGALPPGLTLNSAGGIVGIPAVAGTFAFMGSVTDTAGITGVSPSCSIAISPPPCTYNLSYSSRTFTRDGGNSAVEVTASDVSCPVFASSSVGWLTFSGPLPQYGSSTIYYTVASNQGSRRQTSATVANLPLEIIQDGTSACGSGDIAGLQVLDYKQCGNPYQSQWWDEDYDSNGGVICGPGCLLTAYAEVLSFHGYAYNPSTLNTRLKQLGSQGYTSSGEIVWGAIALVTAGKLHVKAIATSDVDSELCAGRPVILDVGGHFVVATGKVGGKYTINDPGTVQPSTPIDTFVSARAVAP